jgi:hypothetical protein
MKSIQRMSKEDCRERAVQRTERRANTSERP